jgi:hypothetical protein
MNVVDSAAQECIETLTDVVCEKLEAVEKTRQVDADTVIYMLQELENAAPSLTSGDGPAAHEIEARRTPRSKKQKQQQQRQPPSPVTGRLEAARKSARNRSAGRRRSSSSSSSSSSNGVAASKRVGEREPREETRPMTMVVMATMTGLPRSVLLGRRSTMRWLTFRDYDYGGGEKEYPLFFIFLVFPRGES